MTSKKALVIGGTGPTGPFIVQGLLKRGFEVSIFHRGIHEVELPLEVEHIHGDPHFVETMEQALGRRWFDLVVFTYGRLRLAAQVMRQRTGRLIAAGAAAYKVRDEATKSLEGCPVPIPEDSPLQTDSLTHKFRSLIATAEIELMKAHGQGHYAATYLRYPVIVYGPRALAPREWSIVRRILDGRKAIIVADNGLRLVTRGYGENVAHAVLLVVDSADISNGKSYNVGEETTLSAREWISLIAKEMDWQGELVSMPYSVARPSYPYSGAYYHEVLDITRIRKDLGYHDVVPTGEAIRRTIQHYLETRPERGGVEERQLDDPFDYENEDLLIAEYRKAEGSLLRLPFAGYERRHPYAHPKKIGDLG